MDRNKDIVGDFNTPLTSMDISSRQKNKEQEGARQLRSDWKSH